MLGTEWACTVDGGRELFGVCHVVLADLIQLAEADLLHTCTMSGQSVACRITADLEAS